MLLAAGIVLSGIILAFIFHQPPSSHQIADTPAPRHTEVLYLSGVDAPDLWRISIDGQSRTQLTFTGGKVYDFNISADGNRIVYSVQNEQGGFDLWEVPRDGGSEKLQLPCGADWCINPAYSPDEKEVAYSRKKVSGLPGAGPGAASIWLLDMATLSTDPLDPDPAVSGVHPNWSPDGENIAFFDEASGGIRVLNLSALSGFILPSNTGESGSWSPDSRELYFSNTESSGAFPLSYLYAADVQTQITRKVTGDIEQPEDINSPVISPDGLWLAVTVGEINGGQGKQISLIRADGSERQQITHEELYSHGAVSWSSDGSMLVFQRIELGSSTSRPEVMVWDRASGKANLLVEDAALPRWLP